MCDASKVAKISVILLHNCLKVVMELWITIRYDNYDIHGSRLTAIARRTVSHCGITLCLDLVDKTLAVPY